MKKALCILLFLQTIPLVLQAKDRGVTVDQIIAVVDGEAITESELQQESRIALALRQGEAAAFTELDEKVLGAFRDYVVNQMVVSVHVRRLGSVELSQKKIDSAIQKFKAKFRSPSSYDAFKRRFDIGEDKIRTVLRRELRNQIFVKDRLRSRRLGQRLDNGSQAWSDETMSTLLAEMKQTVEIRFLGPNQQLELQ